ncbi:hypothetical protein [Embleya scabrispora]|uniref:hypothetical protein n=1 Tax=Embleya scabrispora TaxID=159449 RepID=UPI001319B9D0|nr:hypothetical protein [Embleya scabrispora]MYS85421.1 hypothetical protein [Streptomyces sp. SID5474]
MSLNTAATVPAGETASAEALTIDQDSGVHTIVPSGPPNMNPPFTESPRSVSGACGVRASRERMRSSWSWYHRMSVPGWNAGEKCWGATPNASGSGRGPMTRPDARSSAMAWRPWPFAPRTTPASNVKSLLNNCRTCCCDRTAPEAPHTYSGVLSEGNETWRCAAIPPSVVL